MQISPDETIYWQSGFIVINATLVFTWVAMILLIGGSWLITRNLSTGRSITVRQSMLESIVSMIQRQIEEVMLSNARPFLAFIGSLFLFIATLNLLSIFPGYRSPTGSLSTTSALAVCVFVVVPIYGIRAQGVGQYLRQYLQPTFFMLPFNIFGELSRTLAMAVRLFGNIMSGEMIIAILLTLVPLFFPVVMQLFGLLIGMIQAYIFAVLAAVYIASAMSDAQLSNED
ncbi:MAG: F0F1 ATP synthase subunit A [Chloroflexota bacterium]|nr:F0F1 ATP synthase subunit A [Chloroflexota bacterium]